MNFTNIISKIYINKNISICNQQKIINAIFYNPLFILSPQNHMYILHLHQTLIQTGYIGSAQCLLHSASLDYLEESREYTLGNLP